ILDVHVNEGEMLNLKTANSVLLTVASRKKMSATASLPLKNAKSIKSGKKIKVEIAGKIYAGHIVSVKFSATSTGSYSISGASDNNVQVRAEFDAFNPQLIAVKGAKLIIQ
ncbi:MAG: HlyD family efflux transporter periplasmic adaptor subunit, partial [Gammaproteobacteria bacterium]|nr:HlyD family efflux transporter periplasmic adaptor subunit [Gammaproteobacteria bacterium]